MRKEWLENPGNASWAECFEKNPQPLSSQEPMDAFLFP